MQLDIDVAKRAQALAETYSKTGTFTMDPKEKCGYNKGAAKTEEEAKGDKWATELWYSKGTGYDWATPVYSPTAQDFTNLIWRSSAKVGFGVAGTKVVALYCDRGNVRGRFACNVCKQNAGCDSTRCPLPDAVCSSTDGAGNAEISLADDTQSIRIIATVRKGQVFSLALGSKSLVQSDLIVFHAKQTAALSFAKDSRASQAGAAPAAESVSAIPNVKVSLDGEYVRFDTTRKLNPGGTTHFVITKGTTHDMAWGQYKTSDFAQASG